MRLHSLIDIIQKVKKKHPHFGKRMSEAQALGRWEIAVGELIAKHSRAVRVKDSVLFVEVDHPAWKSELHYRKKQILDILNGNSAIPRKGLSLPTEILKDIQYLEPRR